MAPKLLILQPSYYRSKARRNVFKVRRRNVVPLTLPYLAALTPADWEVTLADEQVEAVSFDDRFDLVAISTSTLNSYRAYDVADEFRRRSVPVIMGAARFLPRGGRENIATRSALGKRSPSGPKWLRMRVWDGCRRSTGPTCSPVWPALPRPRYELMNLRHYGPFRTFTVVSSRGCPFRCEFCSERFLLGETYRCRPVPEVVEEIKRCRSRSIFFGDSNFGGKRSHALELMEALIPLKVRWSALWPAYLCNDKPFMELARRSGLLHVNIGLESISADTLASMNKRFNKAHQYGAMLANLRRLGISYSLNFIFWLGRRNRKCLPRHPGLSSRTQSSGGLLQHPHPRQGDPALRPVRRRRPDPEPPRT